MGHCRRRRCPRRPCPCLTAALSAVVSLQLFFALNQAADPVTRRLWPGYAGLHPDKQAGWVNLTVSAVHAVTLSVLSVVAVTTLSDYFHSDVDWLRPSLPHTVLPFVAIAVSAGYCAVDTYDMINNGQCKVYFYLIVHHAGILLSFTIGCYLDLGLWYLVLTMLCEINTVFLHLVRRRRRRRRGSCAPCEPS